MKVAHNLADIGSDSDSLPQPLPKLRERGNQNSDTAIHDQQHFAEKLISQNL
jgi:hypothetical protein